MKRIAAAWIVGILVFSGLGISTLNAYASTSQPTPKTMDRTYTHTVLVEVGTATWCPSCPASNSAWHTIYEEHARAFEYTEMVIDKNTVADTYLGARNLYWVPTSYFDGGNLTYPGTSIGIFKNYLDTCGARAVPDLYATMNVSWLGSAKMNITLSIQNNGSTAYTGTLRVYVVEKVSTLWKDYSGKYYNHAFLGFPFNQALSVPAHDAYTAHTTWTCPYSSVTPDNLQVILAVFGSTGHTGYSDPFYEGTTDGAPFTAYYPDETIAVEPSSGGAPLQPAPPTGPTTGYTNVVYSYTGSTTNPTGNPLYYLFDWGDGTNSGWIGPYPSGTPATSSHAWTYGSTFDVKLKAKETLESPWSDPLSVAISGSAIKIEQVTGGLFYVNAVLNNTGADALNQVNWSISLHSGAWIHKNTTGQISAIPGNSQAAIKSKMILGFGETSIKVEASVTGGSSDMVIATGKILLCFIIITSA